MTGRRIKQANIHSLADGRQNPRTGWRRRHRQLVIYSVHLVTVQPKTAERCEMTDEADVSTLIRHPLNPREGDIGAIAASIERNGWFGTVVVQRSTNYVLAGNHRLEAARMLGFSKVPVYWVDVDDDTAKRILLADNRTSDLASYNIDQLADILKDLAIADDLDGTGWDGDDIDTLLHTANKMPMDYPEPANVFHHKCPSCGYRWTD